MSSPLANAIAGLASPDATVRAASGAVLYDQGLALTAAVVSTWLANKEFSSLLWDQPFATVGVAVLPGTFARIRQANGNPKLACVPAGLDAEEFELRLPTEISLDVLSTREPNGEGAIARYLKRFGEGIQQVEFRCKDIDRATEILREKFGVAPVYPETRPGADGTRINFFLVSVPEGGKVLIELYEPSGTH
jgi:hypothetical protein